MKRYTPVWMLIVLCTALVVAGNAPIAPAPRAAAQEATVYPTLTPPVDLSNNGGEAEWEVSDPQFVSAYPQGMSFAVKAKSSAGRVNRARVTWQLSPSVRKGANAVYNEETDIWTAIWESDFSTPSWVGFQYWFVIGDENDNVYTTTPKQAEWSDDRGSWGRAESEEIVIIWQRPVPDRIADLIFDAVRQNRQLYIDAFGSKINYKPRVILYANRRSYREWQPPGAFESVGLTSYEWGGTVQYFYGGDLDFLAYAVVPHEIAHLYQSHTRTRSALTWWIEGSATFFEIKPDYDYKENARKLVNSGIVGSLREDIKEGPTGRPNHYDVGYAFVAYLVETYGIEAYASVIRSMQGGIPLIKSIEQATGQDFDTLDYNWRVWVGANNLLVPTLFPTFTIEFRPTPTLRTFGPRRTSTATAVP